MKMIDCNGMIGRRLQMMKGGFYSANDYIKYMDLYGIEKAFVSHVASMAYDSFFGNMLLIDEIKNFERLLPVWVVMPHYTNEFYKPNEMIKKIQEYNVKMVRICPKTQGFSISSWNTAVMLSAIELAGIPLLIELSEITVDELYELCNNYKKLNIIITNIGYRVFRSLYPLIEKFSNLYLESSSIRGNMATEDICEKFSARRIIFGTGMPVNSGASAVSMLSYANISVEDKMKIGFKNLEGLLG